ncbi:hypothetical protein LUX12_16560 [Streptomyces somaliensis]|uniref:hypothetical protein n=1 Tax=Streptomyces somaliensis TaxID=78355 RepID=UPI0020CC8A91|nr:hypothetical protein [Streptomyces somaliensis]MCP9946050.1 hypothetical protein [Streptomyces somaliensis]MCP9973568.1 hypothetical protein [Streptomyces somaliensis]
MTENNDKLKPPARRPRPKGHVLGGAKKTAVAPPPPAELTREHLDAERAHSTDTDLAPPSTADGGLSPRPTVDPVESPATTHETSATQASEQVRIAAQADEDAEHMSSVPHVAAPAGAPPAAPGISRQPVPDASPAPAYGSSEVAVQEAASAAQGASFPMRAGAAAPQDESEAASGAASNDDAPWTQGAGRPKDIPEAAAVLNQRHITRESLDASVPAALKLKKRIKRFALDNDLDHLPIGDIVCVAVDEWLSRRGF